MTTMTTTATTANAITNTTAAATAGRARRWEDLDVGYSPPPFTDTPLTRTDFVRYQGASGDFNPVHHDEQFAAAAGFPTVSVVGMLPAGVLAAYVTDWLGAANVRRFAVGFREQAWPGDVLTYTATVVRLRENGDERLVDLAIEVSRQTGDLHLTGEATFVVPPAYGE